LKTAVLFPGQGSQSVGMLAGLAATRPVIADTFAEAADVLGTDLWSLAQAGPEQRLADTRTTQPLMFVADIALYRALRQQGLPEPVAFAGHSLGEFAALVASGALPFADGLRLVDTRATLMAAAVPEGEGGMAALIGMEDEAVIALCSDASAEVSADTAGERIVEAVNFNAPGQVAISGHRDALERACELAKGRGARRALMLAVSVPNHSSLMRAAGERLAEAIDALDWRMPDAPLVQNAPAAAPADLAALLGSLRGHVFSPVRWTASVQGLRDGVAPELYLECGPGKVLTGLLKRIDTSLDCRATDTPVAFSAALAAASTTSPA